MAAATADVVSSGRARARTSTRCPSSRSRTAQVSPTTPAPTTVTRATAVSLPRRVPARSWRSGAGGPGGRGVGAAPTLLARDVLLDVLDVVAVAPGHGQQVAHG